MEAEDFIQLPTTCASDSGSGQEEDCKLSNEASQVDAEGDVSNGGNAVVDTEVEEGQLMSETDIAQHRIGEDASYLSENVDVLETVATEVSINVALHSEAMSINDTDFEEGEMVTDIAVAENVELTKPVAEMVGKGVGMPLENGFVTADEAPLNDSKAVGGLPETAGDLTVAGVKRPRAESDEQQSSVHVKYYGLSRQSKRKLEELLIEWSEWSAQNSSVSHDLDDASESGEGTYFPALNIGMGNTSTVSFWVENDMSKTLNKDFTLVEDVSVPKYDRGFALGSSSAVGPSNLEGGLELLDVPRCFNCGSYSHALRDCPKPRDNAAVNSSRKQHKSKRNQTAGNRNVTRYYQDSPSGKYEGLRPGVLDTETRRLLGLGELDPPPWLNRMREIGYPPAYLEPDDEDKPSGITIYAAEETKVEKEEGDGNEEGEISEVEAVELPKKMSVKFPGINAPIPENADEKLWAPRSSNSDRQRNNDGSRSNYSSEFDNRGRYREHNNRDFRDADPLSFERPSRYTSRFSDYDYNSTSRSSRDNAPILRSPNHGRSVGDRERRDLDSEDTLADNLYSSFSFNSDRRFSEISNGSDKRRDDHRDSRDRDRADRSRHRSGR